ncbi:MAG: accessory gene regulator B family protein [Ruminococcus sp.]|nr:accessory gene regulator B family protein [Ruminococcus sp.]
MIEKISEHILHYLLQTEVIKDTQEVKDYYQYGIEITISSMLNVILILLIGIVFNSLAESIVFLLCFIPLRQFTGGYHAKSYFLCNLTFSVSFSIALLVYHLTKEHITTYVGILIVLITCVIFFSECPIENKNKPLSSNKKKVHKALSIVLGSVYGSVAVALISCSYKIGAILLYTLVLINFLIIVATFQDFGKKVEK